MELENGLDAHISNQKANPQVQQSGRHRKSSYVDNMNDEDLMQKGFECFDTDTYSFLFNSAFNFNNFNKLQSLESQDQEIEELQTFTNFGVNSIENNQKVSKKTFIDGLCGC